MRKIIVSILLAGILLAVTACAANSANEIKTEPAAPDESGAPAESPAEPAADTPATPSIEQRLGGAVEDAYAGIEIDAFIRERKAILPGFAVPVTVTVKNTGSETVDYIKGSGSYTIPDALFINVDGLQAVRSKDRLGIATMDFRTEELKPGEHIEFDMYVMAIEPNSKFDSYSMEMYGESGEYIAEKGWPELQEEYPDLIAAKPGAYQGRAYFLYYTRNGAEASNFTTEPNGYAAKDFNIAVS